MAEKPLAWAGSSYKDLTDDNIFSLEARKVAGKQILSKFQIHRKELHYLLQDM